jgi:hypothetical protein
MEAHCDVSGDRMGTRPGLLDGDMPTAGRVLRCPGTAVPGARCGQRDGQYHHPARGQWAACKWGMDQNIAKAESDPGRRPGD